MNIKSKGVRRTLAATCSTAVVLAGASLVAAAPASASTLALTGDTSVTTLNLGSQVSAANSAAATLASAVVTSGSATVTKVISTGTYASPGSAAATSYSAFVGRPVTGTYIPFGTVVVAAIDVVTSSTVNDPTTPANTTTAYTHTETLTLSRIATGGATETLSFTVGGTVASVLGLATYAIRETTAVSSPLRLRLLSAPSNAATLYVGQTSSPTAVVGSSSHWAPLTTATTTGGSRTNDIDVAGNNQLFLTPTVAGTYTFEFFEDVDNDGTPTTGDNVSSVVTLTALNVADSTTGGSTWTPAVTAPTSLPLSSNLPVSVDLSDLSLTDSRGTTGSGTIGAALAGLVHFRYTLTTQGSPDVCTVANAATCSANRISVLSSASALAGDFIAATGYSAGMAYLTEYVTGTAGSVTVGAAFDLNGSSSIVAPSGTGTSITSTTDYILSSTASASVSGTVTAGATVTAVPVSGVVATSSSSSSQIYIKGGTNSAQYKLTGTASTPYRVTLTPSIHSSTSSATCSTTTPTVTGDGTLASSDTSSGVKVYTVTTNSSGLTYLTVTSSDTTSSCAYYTVASSNTLTSDYVTPSPTTVSVANASSDLLPAVGTSSVVLKAKLLDQFGVAVAPLSTKSQEITVSVGSVTGHATVDSSKLFTYTYTPTTAPAAAATTNFTWTYTPSSTDTALTKLGHIYWTASTAASSVSLATPIDGAAHVALSKSGTINVGQSTYTYRDTSHPTGTTDSTGFGDSNGQIIGSVYASGGSVVPHKKVTLSGSPGVYFSYSANGDYALTSTYDVVTNASGGISGVYAYFTKSGTATVTATADDKSDTQTVTVAESIDPYKVTIDDGFGAPGSTITVRGTVKDAFENTVPNQQVSVTISPSGSGTLGGQYASTGFSTSSWLTDSNGVFSATFTPSTGTKGDFTLTAKTYGYQNSTSGVLASNPTADSAWWAIAGLPEIGHGEYLDTSKVTVGPVILSGPSSRASAGFVHLVGVANANATVKIKATTPGSINGLVDVAVVTADTKGDFQADVYVTQTTTFVAMSNVTSGSSTVDLYSPTITVVVASGSSVQATAKITSAKALGKGKVAIVVNGAPNVRGTITLYMNNKKVKSWTSNAWGDGSLTVKTSKGVKTFKATFAPSGCKAGTSSTVKVNVK